MPKRKFALVRGEAKRLQISWQGTWKNCRILLDGQEVGVLADKSELQKGRDFALPDGSTLHIQLTKKLEILRNGKPVSGSPTDPWATLALSYGLIFFIGGGNLLVGLLAEIIQDKDFSQYFGWHDFLAGVIFVALGFLVKHRSKIALGFASGLLSVLLLLRFVLSFAVIAEGGKPIGCGGIIIGIIFLIHIAKGFRAIDQLDREAIQPDSTAAGKGLCRQLAAAGSEPAVLVGLAFLASQLLSLITFPALQSLLENRAFHLPEASYFLANRLPVLLLEATLLVLLLKLFRSDWLVAVGLGLGSLALGFLFHLLFREPIWQQADVLLKAIFTLGSFLWPFCLVLALSAAQRTYGLVWGSVVGWVSIVALAVDLTLILIGDLADNSFRFDLPFILIQLIDGFLTGTILYLGLRWQLLRSRKAQLGAPATGRGDTDP